MSMQIEDLEKACGAYEAEHGIEAFLDAMAEIMRRRMARHGLQMEFDDEDDEARHPVPATKVYRHAGPAAK